MERSRRQDVSVALSRGAPALRGECRAGDREYQPPLQADPAQLRRAATECEATGRHQACADCPYPCGYGTFAAPLRVFVSFEDPDGSCRSSAAGGVRQRGELTASPCYRPAAGDCCAHVDGRCAMAPDEATADR